MIIDVFFTSIPPATILDSTHQPLNIFYQNVVSSDKHLFLRGVGRFLVWVVCVIKGWLVLTSVFEVLSAYLMISRDWAFHSASRVHTGVSWVLSTEGLSSRSPVVCMLWRVLLVAASCGHRTYLFRRCALLKLLLKFRVNWATSGTRLHWIIEVGRCSCVIGYSTLNDWMSILTGLSWVHDTLRDGFRGIFFSFLCLLVLLNSWSFLLLLLLMLHLELLIGLRWHFNFITNPVVSYGFALSWTFDYLICE